MLSGSSRDRSTRKGSLCSRPEAQVLLIKPAQHPNTAPKQHFLSILDRPNGFVKSSPNMTRWACFGMSRCPLDLGGSTRKGSLCTRPEVKVSLIKPAQQPNTAPKQHFLSILDRPNGFVKSSPNMARWACFGMSRCPLDLLGCYFSLALPNKKRHRNFRDEVLFFTSFA